ncbi:uncharacterized protein MEPE_01054 [Melanopsichium pennsylvanicum]|uniref:Matrin-type domain-containing protein n=2 Tax=Melanopsichium pennsylvanicum TaxID=63383 RepID=A0AAJ5C3A5_9BASI|nr:conserved hypothetical protein [Melanopsichium pennsylvanicum 4]SNX82348.1 uncharacterized protein MEPE_01054 [Melanopsichium pennsylvanicum]
MADVWISRKRWTCKYCDVTINDDLPSRRHHESGLRHKHNVQKALQDLYRKGEQERKDAEYTKKEMARIEALAAESYARDQARHPSANPTPTSYSIQAAPATSHSRPKSSTTFARHMPKSTSELAKEAPHSIAQAGEWEVVQPVPQSVSSAPTSSSTQMSDRDRARSFRMKEKVASLDDSCDDEATSIVKIKKRPRTDAFTEDDQYQLPSSVKKEEPVDRASHATTTSAASLQMQSDTGRINPSIPAVKTEEEGGDQAAPTVKQEGGGLFKKRRAGAGAGAKRVRAII